MSNTSSSSGIRTLSPELLEIARERCNEKPEELVTLICGIQAWIKKSPHLKARTDERLLATYLRGTRFSVEECKKRIDGFYTLKTLFPEVLMDRIVNESLINLYRTGIHVIPAKPICANGSRLIISQYSKYNPKVSNPREAFKLLFMLFEVLALEDDHASVAGLTYVIDARDVTMEQMMQYDPYLLKKTWMLVEKCMPLKFTEIHMINMRREGQAIFNFVTTFLPAKMPIKFIVHKKAEDLYTHLPRDAMTIEYGGHNGYQREALDCWEKKLIEYKQYFAQDDNYVTNEKLRVGLSSNWNKDELSGLSGSFRKLEVD